MSKCISIVDWVSFLKVISQLIKGQRAGGGGEEVGKEGNSHFMIVSSSLLWC